jgi:hypothetical protein
MQAAQQFTYIEVRHNATRLTTKACRRAILSGKTPQPGRAQEHRPLLISVVQFNNEEDLLLARFMEAFAVVGEQNTSGLVIIASGSDQ